MGGHSGQQRSSFLSFEPAGHNRCREQTRKAEPAESHRMPRRERNGSEHFGNEVIRMIDETADVSPIAGAVRAEGDRRLIEVSIKHPGPTSVEWVGNRDFRMDPIANADRSEEGGRNAERVDRGTDVMEESRERELLGACAAANCVGTLNNEDPPTRSRQFDGGCKPVRSGTNNNTIESSHPRIMASSGNPTRGPGPRNGHAAPVTPHSTSKG
jgi:hypothetical protein